MSFYDQPDRQWDNASVAPPQPAGEPSSLRGLRTALTVLFSVAVVLTVVIMIALLRRVAYIDDIIDGTADPAQADSVDGFVAVSYVLWGLLVLAIVPVFIVWQYRHAKNARVLGSTTWGPGWAIGGWFIPFANAFLPARQLWVASKFSDSRQSGAGIVVAWWLTFIISGVVVQASTDTAETYTLEQLRDSDITGVVGEVLSIAAAVLAIVMVRGLTSRQESMLDQRLALIGQPQAYGSWPAPPPGAPYGRPSYGPAPYGQSPYAPSGAPYSPAPPQGQNPPPSPFAPPPAGPAPSASDGPPAPPPVPPSSTP